MSWITGLFGRVVSLFRKPPPKHPPKTILVPVTLPLLPLAKKAEIESKKTTLERPSSVTTTQAVTRPAQVAVASDMDRLAELVQAEGFPLKKQGRSYGGPICPVCGEAEYKSSNRLCIFEGRDKPRWKCHACGASGDWPEFLCKSRGIYIGQALKLAGQETLPPSQRQPSSRPPNGNGPVAVDEQQTSEALLKVIQMLKALAAKIPDEEMSRFLYEKRRLSVQSVQLLADLQIVRFLPSDPFQAMKFLKEKIGEPLLFESGLWKKGSKWPAIAFRPCISFYGEHSINFRQIRESEEFSQSNLRYGIMKFPIVWKRGSVVKRFLITEGVFDMVSLAELGYVLPEDAVMAIPGTETWREIWIQMIGKKYPDIEVIAATDADKPGDQAALKIGKFCESIGVRFQRLRPNHPDCKDWNEILIKKDLHQEKHKIFS